MSYRTQKQRQQKKQKQQQKQQKQQRKTQKKQQQQQKQKKQQQQQKRQQQQQQKKQQQKRQQQQKQQRKTQKKQQKQQQQRRSRKQQQKKQRGGAATEFNVTTRKADDGTTCFVVEKKNPVSGLSPSQLASSSVHHQRNNAHDPQLNADAPNADAQKSTLLELKKELGGKIEKLNVEIFNALTGNEQVQNEAKRFTGELTNIQTGNEYNENDEPDVLSGKIEAVKEAIKNAKTKITEYNEIITAKPTSAPAAKDGAGGNEEQVENE